VQRLTASGSGCPDPGYRFIIQQVSYRGYADMDEGTTAWHSTHCWFRGTRAGARGRPLRSVPPFAGRASGSAGACRCAQPPNVLIERHALLGESPEREGERSLSSARPG